MLIFKAKLLEGGFVKIPSLGKNHAEDLNSLRNHPKIGGFINSNMADGIIKRYVKNELKISNPGLVNINDLPPNMEIAKLRFLITFRIKDNV